LRDEEAATLSESSKLSSLNQKMSKEHLIVGVEHHDEHEAVGHRWNHEEIGRDDLADLIPQKRLPRLRWGLASTAHVFRDGRLTDVDPELQQFAMNPRRAPQWVRLRHRANQRAHVGRHGGSVGASATFPCPTKGSPVDARR